VGLMALWLIGPANAERIEPKPIAPLCELAPVIGWGHFRLPVICVAVGIFKTGKKEPSGALQDTFGYGCRYSPTARMLHLQLISPHLCGPLPKSLPAS
jgi:hypothetical protein